MPKLVILGTSNAIPHPEHENSHMVLVGEKRMVLIDGPGNPQVRLAHAGLSHEDLTDIVITHFHPDHVSGVPLLLMGMGLLKREKPIAIYANEHCMELVHTMLKNYEWNTWHFFPVNFHLISDDELHPLIDTDEFRICSSPVKHFIPTVGLRIDMKESGKVVAYSCDTAPTPSLYALAKDVDLLIHEAAGASLGHSSAEQAAEIAIETNAKELVLIHYPTTNYDYSVLATRAESIFGKPVTMAEDFMEFEY